MFIKFQSTAKRSIKQTKQTTALPAAVSATIKQLNASTSQGILHIHVTSTKHHITFVHVSTYKTVQAVLSRRMTNVMFKGNYNNTEQSFGFCFHHTHCTVIRTNKTQLLLNLLIQLLSMMLDNQKCINALYTERFIK